MSFSEVLQVWRRNVILGSALSPPSFRVFSHHRVTPLWLLYLLFSGRVVASLFPLLQVRGIGLAASPGHGVTSGSAPQLLHQVPEYLSWLLVLFRAFPTMSTWSLELEMFGLCVRHLIARKLKWVDQLSSVEVWLSPWCIAFLFLN